MSGATINQFTSTCFELFETVPVLNPIIGSNVQEVFPSTSLDERSFEYEYETDRNNFLDFGDTYLLLKVKLQDSAISVKREEGKKHDVYPVNFF